MAGSQKLLTSGGGGVVIQPATNIATDVTMQIPSENGTLASQNYVGNAVSQFNGFKNRIINGRFDVWQRSVGPVTGSGYTTADRWNFPSSMTTQQVANDRDTSIPFALQVTADGTGYGQVFQRIEDVRSLSGGNATLSFWAKSPNTGVFRCEIGQLFGSGGSTAVYPLSNTSQFNMVAANTWQFFTVTVAMPSVSGKTIGAGSSVQIQFGADSGIANRVMTYSEVQFEKGSTATSFDYRPYGTELALCERYYQRFSSTTATSFTAFGGGYAYSTTNINNFIPFNVRMRTAPSALDASAANSFLVEYGSSALTPSAINLNANGSPDRGGAVFTVSGATAGGAYFAYAAGSTTAYIGFTAEL